MNIDTFKYFLIFKNANFHTIGGRLLDLVISYKHSNEPFDTLHIFNLINFNIL